MTVTARIVGSAQATSSGAADQANSAAPARAAAAPTSVVRPVARYPAVASSTRPARVGLSTVTPCWAIAAAIAAAHAGPPGGTAEERGGERDEGRRRHSVACAGSEPVVGEEIAERRRQHWDGGPGVPSRYWFRDRADRAGGTGGLRVAA